MRENRILLLGPPGAGKSNVSETLGTLFTYLLVMEWMEFHNLDRDVRTQQLLFRHYHRIADTDRSDLLPHYAEEHPGSLDADVLGSLDRAIAAGRFRFYRISTGEVLRERIRSGELPDGERKRIERGELVSDQYVQHVLEELLREVSWRNFLLDGYPRNVDQLKYLWNRLQTHDEEREISGDRPVDYVVHVTIEREEAERRILGRRVCPNPGCRNVSFSYNIYFQEFAPRKTGLTSSDGDYETGLCDTCGTELVRRKDDSPEVFASRWDQYTAEILPVIKMLEEEHWMRIHDVPAKMSTEVLAVHLTAQMGDLKSRYILGM